MTDDGDVKWEVKITHDGIWPTSWRWSVVRSRSIPWEFASRSGFATTKNRARRKAIEAKQSMETEDVAVTW